MKWWWSGRDGGLSEFSPYILSSSIDKPSEMFPVNDAAAS